jgi:hypothetical protein
MAVTVEPTYWIERVVQMKEMAVGKRARQNWLTQSHPVVG